MEQDLRAKIIARAWKDETFRKKLLTDPKAALKEFGVDIPDDVEMKVVTEDAHHAYFVLPTNPSNKQELRVVELEKLASGACALGSHCDPGVGPSVLLQTAPCIGGFGSTACGV